MDPIRKFVPGLTPGKRVRKYVRIAVKVDGTIHESEGQTRFEVSVDEFLRDLNNWNTNCRHGTEQYIPNGVLVWHYYARPTELVP